MKPHEKAEELLKTFKTPEMAIEAVKLVLSVIPYNLYSVVFWWEEVINTLKIETDDIKIDN